MNIPTARIYRQLNREKSDKLKEAKLQKGAKMEEARALGRLGFGFSRFLGMSVRGFPASRPFVGDE